MEALGAPMVTSAAEESPGGGGGDSGRRACRGLGAAPPCLGKRTSSSSEGRRRGQRRQRVLGPRVPLLGGDRPTHSPQARLLPSASSSTLSWVPWFSLSPRTAPHLSCPASLGALGVPSPSDCPSGPEREAPAWHSAPPLWGWQGQRCGGLVTASHGGSSGRNGTVLSPPQSQERRGFFIFFFNF